VSQPGEQGHKKKEKGGRKLLKGRKGKDDVPMGDKKGGGKEEKGKTKKGEEESGGQKGTVREKDRSQVGSVDGKICGVQREDPPSHTVPYDHSAGNKSWHLGGSLWKGINEEMCRRGNRSVEKRLEKGAH